MAPAGHDCFYVLVPVPNNQSKIDWSIEGEKIKNLVVDKMEKDLMPNLKENIVEDFYLTPNYFEKELNTKYGSGFSIQPKFSQSAYFRFHNKSELYNGLFFVGAGTHPGAGVPGVLSSAKVLDKIIKCQKKTTSLNLLNHLIGLDFFYQKMFTMIAPNYTHFVEY